jgi:opacity protein-like surface antigen
MGRFQLIILASAMLAIGLSSAASADWAYTHWGMSPEQVAAASGGSVKVLGVGKQTRDEADHWVLAAQGSTVQDGLNLGVGFTFDTRTNGLKCVMYNALGNDVATLKAALVRRYGKPASVNSYGSAETLAWRQPDTIEFTSGPGPAVVVTHCTAEEG